MLAETSLKYVNFGGVVCIEIALPILRFNLLGSPIYILHLYLGKGLLYFSGECLGTFCSPFPDFYQKLPINRVLIFIKKKPQTT